jgi:hypothetical protein
MSKQAVVIHPGFSEDAFHFEGLVHELQKQEYVPHVHQCFEKDDRTTAHINITHSGGYFCSDIVTNTKDYVLVLSPPLHSRHLRSMIHKVMHDYLYCKKKHKTWFWVKKTSRNIWLVISKPIYHYHFYKNTNRYINRLERLLQKRSNVLVITTEDHWVKGFPHTRHYSITPGLHDDVIYHPKKYVDMMEYSLKHVQRVQS